MIIGIDARFWNETGVGRYIQNLVSNLADLDKKNTYVVFMRSQDLGKIKQITDATNISFIGVNIPWHSLKEQFQFTRVIKRSGVDLMHFTYFSVPLNYNRPFVITIHDLILHHFPTGEASTLSLPLYYVKWLAYKMIIRSAASRALRIIAVSNATKKEIIEHLHIPEEKICVTYEGVDKSLELKTSVPTANRQDPRTETKSERYFLHVGNVYPHKDPRLLVEAFSRRADPSLKLYFVGKKDHFMDTLKKYVNDLSMENIVFKGFVSDSDLASLYKNAIATVVSSKMEGFGLPALEAMANSCLVVASDIPSLREVTKGKAFFFKQGDAFSLTNVLNTIAKASKNQYASQKNEGKAVAGTYSWKEMTNETIKSYESCNSLRQDQ